MAVLQPLPKGWHPIQSDGPPSHSHSSQYHCVAPRTLQLLYLCFVWVHHVFLWHHCISNTAPFRWQVPNKYKKTDKPGKLIVVQGHLLLEPSLTPTALQGLKGPLRKVSPILLWQKQTSPRTNQPFTTKLCFYITILHYFLTEPTKNISLRKQSCFQ